MYNVQERQPLMQEPSFGQTAAASDGLQNTFGGNGAYGPQNDAIRRTFPVFRQPEQAGPGNDVLPAGGAGGLISQLLSTIGQLLQALGLGGMIQGQTFFQNATASSIGDPHLAFDGTACNGQTEQTKFDSMCAHNDLLDSQSFAGGYRVSTTVTSPSANGVTYNQSATVSTGCGGTQVSLDNAGNASVVENGNTIALSNGQTLNIGNGETVTRNQDGSVIVTDYSQSGGEIATTLADSGPGVNVNATAQNVALGGDVLPRAAAPW